MQLGSASLCAVEKERAAARELAADMAKVEKKLEAEKKRCSMEKEKRESLLAECERLALELEDAHDESDEGGDDGSFTPEETKPEKGDEQIRPGLLGLVGRKGEKYTLEMMELGMELMGQGMTAPKARSVLVIFMKKAHPDLIVGVDYRIPDPMMFKRWRTYLEPLSQFMALRAVDQAKVVHLLHDATSKKGVSFFSVCARITVIGKTQNVPLAFKVRPLMQVHVRVYLLCVANAEYLLFLCDRLHGTALPPQKHRQSWNPCSRTSRNWTKRSASTRTSSFRRWLPAPRMGQRVQRKRQH